MCFCIYFYSLVNKLDFIFSSQENSYSTHSIGICSLNTHAEAQQKITISHFTFQNSTIFRMVIFGWSIWLSYNLFANIHRKAILASTEVPRILVEGHLFLHFFKLKRMNESGCRWNFFFPNRTIITFVNWYSSTYAFVYVLVYFFVCACMCVEYVCLHSFALSLGFKDMRVIFWYIYL